MVSLSPPPLIIFMLHVHFADSTSGPCTEAVLTERKIGVLKFLERAAVVLPDALVMHFLVAACDPQDPVSRLGDEQLRKRCVRVCVCERARFVCLCASAGVCACVCASGSVCLCMWGLQVCASPTFSSLHTSGCSYALHKPCTAHPIAIPFACQLTTRTVTTLPTAIPEPTTSN